MGKNSLPDNSLCRQLSFILQISKIKEFYYIMLVKEINYVANIDMAFIRYF